MFESISVLSPITDGTDIGNAVSEANRDLANADDSFRITMPCRVVAVECWSNNAATANFTVQFTSYVDGAMGTLADCGQVTVPASANANVMYVDYVATTAPLLKIGSQVLVHVSDAGDSGDNAFYRLVVSYSPEVLLDAANGTGSTDGGAVLSA